MPAGHSRTAGRVRVYATGTTGFLWSVVAEQLRARGDTVVQLVRDPAKAELPRKAKRDVVIGDLADPDALKRGCAGCDAVVHAGAIYEVGISAPRQVDMYEANVKGTERVLNAALAAGVPRVVHVSPIVVFGNKRDDRGRDLSPRRNVHVLLRRDEDARAPPRRRLHRAGLPIAIVQPGQIYGPGDHSGIGALFRRAAAGTLPVLTFGDLGLSFVHVADVAAGIVTLIDRGRPGQAALLGGEMARRREAVRVVTSLAGKPAPRFALPASILRFAARLRPVVAEVMRSADGVTFWATDAKARAELGYTSRSLREGLVSYLSSSSSSSSSNSSE